MWWLVMLLGVGVGVAHAAPAANARAQPAGLPAASAPLIPGSRDVLSGHAWMAVPVPAIGGEGEAGAADAVVLHLPPRDSADRSPSGTLRLATRLAELPDALAAWSDRLYVVFPRERWTATNSGWQRRVISLRARATVPGLWDYQGSVAGAGGGGPQSLPLLEGENVLIAAVGGPDSPLVLMREGLQGLGAWRLLSVVGEAWRDVTLPWTIAGGRGKSAVPIWAGMAVSLDGLVVLVEWADRPGELEQFSGEWAARPGPGVVGPISEPVVWAGASKRLPLPADLSAEPYRLRALWPDGQLTLVGPLAGGTELGLYAVNADGDGLVPRRVVTIPLVSGGPGALLSLDGLGRIVAVSQEPEAAIDPEARRARGMSALAVPRLLVREVSAFTGATLFTGPARSEGLISGRDFQILTLVVAGVMLAVLMFVLRSDEQGVIPLPTGTALAPPARRVLAALIDLAGPVLLVCAVFQIAPENLISWSMFTNRDEALPVATAWLVTFGHCVVGEWLLGASVGKRIMGVRVVGIRKLPAAEAAEAAEADQPDSSDQTDPAVEGDSERFGSAEVGPPTLRQALLRNALRWLVPPLALLAFADSNWRHPGDVLANTLVVIPPPLGGFDEP
jgi:uncharacterized RDD family membrane protein YckC